MAELYVPGSATDQDASATNSSEDQKLKEDAEKLPQPVETAFLVFLGEDGQWIGTSDLSTNIAPQRIASIYDMFSGATSIADDISANKTAQHVQAMMMMQAQQMQKQMQQQAAAQDVMSKIQRQGGFRGR